MNRLLLPLQLLPGLGLDSCLVAFVGLLLHSEEGWRLEGPQVNELLLSLLVAVQPQLPSQYLTFSLGKDWRLILQVVGEASNISRVFIILWITARTERPKARRRRPRIAKNFSRRLVECFRRH